VSRAAFNLSRVILIGGENAAGKSSVTAATAAALTGNPLPIRGVKKSEAGCMVRSGTADGSVTLETDAGKTEIAWPKAQVKTTGEPPQASEYAAGLSCVLKLDAKKRAQALSDYLQAEPTRADFDQALQPLELPAKQMDGLWDTIVGRGWDGAAQQVKEKGATLKGAWEQITGERYGSKKADNYISDGWGPDLDGVSLETLEADLADARQVLEGCIASEAVDDARCEDLERQVAGIVGIKEQIEVLTDELQQAADAHTERYRVAEKLPRPEPVPVVCPHCGGALSVSDGQVAPARPVDEKENAKRQQALDAAREELDGLAETADGIERKLNDARAELKAAEKAARELDELNNRPEAVGDIDAARTSVQQAEARLRAWKQKTEADGKHRAICLNAEILARLAPGGIRQQKLADALGTANAGLLELSKVSGFGLAAIDGGLGASLNGTPYGLLCKSERWRVRVLLQIWMAQADNSAAVIIDGADIVVNRPLRNGLFNLLRKVDLPALVTMALPGEARENRKLFPDLKKAKRGVSYWIENNELVEVGK
jgi:hypothetical protein